MQSIYKFLGHRIPCFLSPALYIFSLLFIRGVSWCAALRTPFLCVAFSFVLQYGSEALLHLCFVFVCPAASILATGGRTAGNLHNVSANS